MLAAVIVCNNDDDHVGYSGIGSCGMQHQKKSEVQIGKESRGVSSDYQRAPLLTLPNDSNDIGILGWQDEVLSTPHKRVGQVMQSNKGKAVAMAKLTRNPSSLSRSPTIKDRIDTFPCLHETSDHKPSRWIWQEIAARRRSDRDEMMTGRRFKFQVLLPPFVIVSIPCFWWYLKVVQKDQALVDLPSDAMDVPSDTIVLGLWFDFFAVLVFVTAVVISIKIAFPQLSVGYILPSMRLVRGKLGQSWGCLAVAWMKPIAGLLADGKERKRIPGSPSVTWTIGSKPKLERSKIVREGVQVYSNGDVYEGEFHQGKCSGSGVYYYYMSGRYEGDWVDGKYDGYGVETWARGSRYRGQYRQGLRHGYGVYRFYTGDVYAGEWCNGQSHGYGVHTCEDGSRYVGEFKWGVKHGLGYYHFRNGDTYSGEYFADKMHGFGVYHFANGHRYEGAWHEGRKQGLGMYIFRNGERQSGNWHQGVLETPSTQSSQPGPPIAVNHSKVLNAVQEARHAAEKAFEIPRVDERVNKAISAANRAANAARVAAVKAVQKRMHGNVPVPDV